MQSNILETSNRKVSIKNLIKFNAKYIKTEIVSFSIAFILLLLNIGCSLASPYIISYIVDELVVAKEFIVILKLVLVSFAIALINQVFFYLESMIMQHAGQRIILQMRIDVFKHVESMSQNQFDKMPVGSLVTRVASYTQSMSDLFTNDLVKILKDLLMVVGVYILMFTISVELSLIMLIFIVVLLIVSIGFSFISTKLFRNERVALSDMNTYLNENLSLMKITECYNQEDRKVMEFKEKNDTHYRARRNQTISFAIYRPFITLLLYTSIAVIFYIGISNNFNAGAIVAFYLYTSYFFHPLEELADKLNNVNKALTASEKLIALMSIKPEVRDLEDAIEVERVEGKIEFRNVWFAYKGEEWILKDVSFTINPREMVAFVGKTGAGKTTILSLIVRNYEVTRGSILIDDIDIRHIKLASLRKLVGQMLQDVYIFTGDIKSNITLHDEKYTDQDVMDAINYSNANIIIDKFEKGLNEPVQINGSNLSQGEKQLLSFSRTVIAKPNILILDEATSNIDTETEQVIQKSLENIKNIGTMIVVAHRLSTIQHSDKIIVLKDGEILESGKHQELLKNKGYYHKLYMLQQENGEIK